MECQHESGLLFRSMMCSSRYEQAGPEQTLRAACESLRGMPVVWAAFVAMRTPCVPLELPSNSSRCCFVPHPVQVSRREHNALDDEVEMMQEGTTQPRGSYTMSTAGAGALAPSPYNHKRAISKPSPSLLHDTRDEHASAMRCGREQVPTLGRERGLGRGHEGAQQEDREEDPSRVEIGPASCVHGRIVVCIPRSLCCAV